MLEKIDFLSRDTLALIIYVNSATLQTILKKRIKERFNIARNLTRYAENNATLKEVKNQTFTPPFGGGTWLVDIQADKIGIADIGRYLNNVTNASISVIWVTNYSQYKKIVGLKVVEKLGNHCFRLYTGKLYPEDIGYVQNQLLSEEKRLPKKLLDYLKKNYVYDVDSVCKIFELIKQGDEIKTTKDIINRVGLGGNTVDSFIVRLLSANPKTEKGLKSAMEKNLLLLRDLSYTYEYRSIKNFMRATLKAMIEMKELQIMGLYSEHIQNIPETGFNTDKLERLRRYERFILNEANMGRLVNLLLCLEKYNNFNTEVDLLQGISSYMIWVYKKNEENPDSKEMPNRYIRRI